LEQKVHVFKSINIYKYRFIWRY